MKKLLIYLVLFLVAMFGASANNGTWCGSGFMWCDNFTSITEWTQYNPPWTSFSSTNFKNSGNYVLNDTGVGASGIFLDNVIPFTNTKTSVEFMYYDGTSSSTAYLYTSGASWATGAPWVYADFRPNTAVTDTHLTYSPDATSNFLYNYTNHVWYDICVEMDANYLLYYVNGVLLLNHTNGGALNMGNFVDIGFRGDSTNGIIFDNMTIWNGACQLSPSSTALVYPVDTKHYNQMPGGDYNGSIILYKNEPISCYLNDTRFSLVGSNASQTIVFQNNTAIIDQEYKLDATCNGSIIDILSFSFVIDTVDPVITINAPTANSYHRTNIPIDVVNFDMWLYRVNTTLKNQTKFTCYNDDSGVLPGGTTWYNLSGSMNIGACPDGIYTLNISTADTHTIKDFKESIKETKNIEGDKIRYKLDLEHGDFFIIYDNDMNIKAIKEKDRFIFEHTFDKKKNSKVMVIEADRLDYLSDSPYPGHFIINGKYWFDTEGLPNVRIYRTKINQYEITFDATELKITTKSLGGLNEVSTALNLTIDKTSPTLVKNSTSILGGTSATVIFNISEDVNYTMNISSISCSGAPSETKTSLTYSSDKVISWGGLSANTTYHINAGFYDRAGNDLVVCYNVTTSTYDLYIDSAQIFLNNPAVQLEFKCEAFDSLGRNVTYGYNITKNNVSIYQDFWIGEGHVKNWFNNTGAVNNPYRAFDDNFTTFADFDALGDNIYFNISKKVVTTNETAIRLTIDMYNGAFAGLGGDPIISCVDDINDITSLIPLTTIYKTGQFEYQLIINRTTAENCIKLSDEFFYININVTSAGILGMNIYEIYNISAILPNQVAHNVTRDVVIYQNPMNGNYSFTCTAWNGYDFAEAFKASSVKIPSIQFFLYDEQTGELITNFSTITIISDDPAYQQNFIWNFTGGGLLVESLDVIDYNIIYNSGGYNKRHYYLATEDFQVNGSFNLFLLNESVGGFSIIRVIDQNLNAVEGAIVRVLKVVPGFNAKQTISILRTNFEGEATLDFVRHTDNYQFVVELNGMTVLTSTETQVSKEVVKIQIVVNVDTLESMKLYSKSNGNAVILNGTSTDKICHFTYFGYGIKEACVRLYSTNLLRNDVLEADNCSTALSGTLSLSFDVSNITTYICEGWVDTNTTGSFYPIAQAIFTSNPGRNIFGRLGLLLGLLLILGMAFMMKETPSMMILGALVGLVFASLGFLISLPYGGLMMIILIGGFFMIRMRR